MARDRDPQSDGSDTDVCAAVRALAGGHSVDSPPWLKVLRRDPCVYCGSTTEAITMDHIEPVREGAKVSPRPEHGSTANLPRSSPWGTTRPGLGWQDFGATACSCSSGTRSAGSHPVQPHEDHARHPPLCPPNTPRPPALRVDRMALGRRALRRAQGRAPVDAVGREQDPLAQDLAVLGPTALPPPTRGRARCR